jgi:hypothetical protein
MLCSLEEARSAGAIGDDGEVTAAIEAAGARVEGYTGQVFEPRVITLLVDVDEEGIARLRHRVIAVSEVRWDGDTVVHPPESYLVRTSAQVGDYDTVVVRAWGSNMLVAGAEPWNGGFEALAAGWGRRLLVTGTFGWSDIPERVRRGTALVAAWLRSQDRTQAPDETAAPEVDPEGNVLPVVPSRRRDADAPPTATTTGTTDADRELQPFRRNMVRVG